MTCYGKLRRRGIRWTSRCRTDGAGTLNLVAVIDGLPRLRRCLPQPEGGFSTAFNVAENTTLERAGPSSVVRLRDCARRKLMVWKTAMGRPPWIGDCHNHLNQNDNLRFQRTFRRAGHQLPRPANTGRAAEIANRSRIGPFLPHCTVNPRNRRGWGQHKFSLTLPKLTLR